MHVIGGGGYMPSSLKGRARRGMLAVVGLSYLYTRSLLRHLCGPQAEDLDHARRIIRNQKGLPPAGQGDDGEGGVRRSKVKKGNAEGGGGLGGGGRGGGIGGRRAQDEKEESLFIPGTMVGLLIGKVRYLIKLRYLI
jgi:hypothetical protein